MDDRSIDPLDSYESAAAQDQCISERSLHYTHILRGACNRAVERKAAYRLSNLLLINHCSIVMLSYHHRYFIPSSLLVADHQLHHYRLASLLDLSSII